MLLSLIISMTAVVAGVVEETVVVHEKYPSHKLTVKNPKSLGVDKVNQYSGYINARNGAHMFYWAFESRNDPANDPTVLWLNGGPGCSSLQAVFFENGPATLDSSMKLTRNPYSWNNKANVIYLDQPVGAGFSDGGEQVSTTPDAAVDVNIFLKLFFKQNPHLAREHDFHISGESYGGRYIPTFAEHIMTNPDRAINISSVIIGNGLVDPVAQYSAYEPMLCGQGGYPQKISQYQCAMMRAALPNCIDTLNSCINGGDESAGVCQQAQLACQSQELSWRNLNPYDIRDDQCAPASDGLCYPAMDYINQYLNQDSVKRTIGADPQIDYSTCNNDINERFNGRHDSFTHTQSNVTSLLDKGVKVLVYSGDKDIICNWLGGRQWTTQLDWNGQSQFQSAVSNMNSWTNGGKEIGKVANYKHLTFLRVYDAGHMVPHDQPLSAYAMIQGWLNKDLGYKKDMKLE